LSAGKELAYLHDRAQVLRADYQDDGVHIEANIAPDDQGRFRQYLA
ncbi:GTPase HflX, partial [Lactobacillus sp. UMNPBX10]